MRSRKPPTWVAASRIGILVGVALVIGSGVVRDVQARGFEHRQIISQVLLIAGLVIMLCCIAANFGAILRAVRERKTAEGANTVVLAVLAVVLVSLLCYISTRRFARVDMTGNRRFSLHTQTENMLRSLKVPVRITVVYQELPADPMYGDPTPQLMQWGFAQTMDMLEEFKARTAQITVEQLNLEDPKAVENLTAKLADVPARCVIFECGDSHDVIPFTQIVDRPQWQGGMPTFTGESAFDSALAKITEKEKLTIYFLTGHGERPLMGQLTMPGMERNESVLNSEQFSLSRLVKKLRDDNFESKPLNLAETPTVPEDCKLLVIAGPRVQIPPAQLEAIMRYLEGPDARAIIMTDSRLGDEQAQSNIGDLLKHYGVTAHEEALGMYVSQEYGMLVGKRIVPVSVPNVPITENGYMPHGVTKDLRNYTLNFVSCAPLEVAEGPPAMGLAAHALLRSIDSSWGETTAQRDMKLSKYDRGADVAGPVVAGAVIEPEMPQDMPPMAAPADMPGPRIVVLGSSMSFVNQVVEQASANLYLMLNAVNWLAGKGHMVGIPPKDMDINIVSLSDKQSHIARWVFILILPACVIVVGLVVWQFRRR